MLSPWDGDTGFSISGHVAFTDEGRPRRYGVEFEFRDYETTVRHVSGFDLHSYKLNLFASHLFALEEVKPYLGLGISLSVNVVSHDALVYRDTGGGIGAFALLGVEVPLDDRLSLFSEARVGADVQVIGERYVENVGGVSLTGGMRFRF